MHRCRSGSRQGWWASQIHRCQPPSVSACLSVPPVWLFVYCYICLTLHLLSVSVSVLLPALVCINHARLSSFLFLISVTCARCILSSNSCASQVLKKDSQHVEARGMWDVLRRGTSQVLFSDLAEVALPSLATSSLLWLHSYTTQQVLTVLTCLFLIKAPVGSEVVSTVEQVLDLCICPLAS